MLTGGFTKGHVNATVTGPEEQAATGTPIEFCDQMRGGVTPSEYIAQS